MAYEDNSDKSNVSREALEHFIRLEMDAAASQISTLEHHDYSTAIVVMRSQRIMEKIEGKDVKHIPLLPQEEIHEWTIRAIVG